MNAERRKKFIWNEKRMGYLIIHRTIILFANFLIIFRHYYYAKWMFLTSLTWVIFFKFLLYREILKFWWNQTIGWECTCHASLITIKIFSSGFGQILGNDVENKRIFMWKFRRCSTFKNCRNKYFRILPMKCFVCYALNKFLKILNYFSNNSSRINMTVFWHVMAKYS